MRNLESCMGVRRRNAGGLLVYLVLLPACAWAQGGIQNMDIYLGFGGFPIQSQTVVGTATGLSSSVAATASFAYGYQISHWSNASLWIEIPFSYEASHQRTSVLPGNVELDTSFITPGLRFMVPVRTRVSVFGSAGGGVGFYQQPELVNQAAPSMIIARNPIHGVVDFAGGVDFRVNRTFSIRVQVRDFVSGHNLSGVAGVNHIMPTVGLGYHF